MAGGEEDSADPQTVVLIPESSSHDYETKSSTIRPRFSIHYGLRQCEFEEKYKNDNGVGTQSESIWQSAKNEARKRCTRDSVMNVLHRRLPVIRVISGYRWKKDILGDLLAGISVGVMTIPQSLGYALLASVPAVLGLYTSVFPVIIYFMFATSRHVSIGTMALSSLVIAAAVQRGIGQSLAVKQAVLTNDSLADSSHGRIELNAGGGNIMNDQIDSLHADGIIEVDQGLDVTGQSKFVTSDMVGGTAEGGWSQLEEEQIVIAISVSCLAGLIMIVMSLCRLGFIVSYMSEAFISGYLASSNLRVLTHQVALILGIKPSPRGLVIGEYFMFVYDLLRNIASTNLIQLMISVITIITLVVVKHCVNERYKHRLKVPIPIDVIAIALATFLSHYLSLHISYNVQVLTTVPSGLPTPMAPSLACMSAHVFDAVMLALISYLLVAMMARLFSDRHGYEIDCDQELLANGLACVGGSFFCSLACSTSPPRCFLMETSGGRTQLSHLFSSVIVLLAVCFIAPFFASLPICVLACVIIVACVPLFNHYSMWLVYYRTDPYDLSVWAVTVAANLLLSVDVGLVVGVAFSLVSTHYRMQHSVGMVLECNDEDFIFYERNGRKNITRYQQKQGHHSGNSHIERVAASQRFVSSTRCAVEDMNGANSNENIVQPTNAADDRNDIKHSDVFKDSEIIQNSIQHADAIKNLEQEQRVRRSNEIGESVFLFRFESPLYYATLDTFKQQLFMKTVSLTRLKAERKKREEQEAKQKKKDKLTKEVRFVQIRSKTQGELSDGSTSGKGVTLGSSARKVTALNDEEVRMMAVETGACGNVDNNNQGLSNEGQRAEISKLVENKSQRDEAFRKNNSGKQDGEPFSKKNTSSVNDSDVTEFNKINKAVVEQDIGTFDNKNKSLMNQDIEQLNRKNRSLANQNIDSFIGINQIDMMKSDNGDDRSEAVADASDERLYIVLDCSAISFLDTGGGKLLAELYEEYRRVNVRLVLASTTSALRERLGRVGQCSSLNQLAVYPTVHDAIVDINRWSISSIV